MRQTTTDLSGTIFLTTAHIQIPVLRLLGLTRNNQLYTIMEIYYF